MAFIGIRELSRRLSRVLDELQEDGEPVVITKQGRPIAALLSVDAGEIESLVLSAASPFQKRREEADRAVAAGEAVRLSDVMPALIAEEDVPAETAQAAPGVFMMAGDVDQQINSIHDLVFGQEAPADVIAAAKFEIGAAIEPVVQSIGPDAPAAEERLGRLATNLFGVFLTHSLFGEAQDRLADAEAQVVAHPPAAEPEIVALDDVAKVAVDAAAEQLRSFNVKLVNANLGHGEAGLHGYQTAVESIVSFDEVRRAAARHVSLRPGRRHGRLPAHDVAGADAQPG